ncbi:GntR family transcriptional regulator [Ochrovirga pacifica]|uniref:GntR family transcriptional regulator n=1 Tax=Ochrovirga pacifica TaxID=1042376 RepID=UPI0002557F59|nr:winged helix-turn-helix domain-containing protein [Ochrovirga pacifica]
MTLAPIEKKLGIPKYKQIINAVIEAIVEKKLNKGDKLPSISKIQKENKVSRDTVLTALNELKTRGIVQSIAGKGYYVLSEDVGTEKKVFLLFDELNSFKEDLYSNFLEGLDENTQVDIYFHHFNPAVFTKLIYENIGNYSSYVIMPANLKNTVDIIEKLPQDKVYILDQLHEDLHAYAAIYQNFEKDILSNLTNSLSKIQKYSSLVLIFNPKVQPEGMKKGFEMFCNQYQMDYDIVPTAEDRELLPGEIYIIPDDKNLIRVVKKIKEQGLVLSQNIGIISYNETLLKEIVEGGITTISTDFKAMGKRLAQMINKNEHLQIENRNQLILRNSL